MFMTSSVVPPRNWQDFERLCADLWRRVWNDPYAQANGRQGQSQHGVDIVGRINGNRSYAGVQCKGKDRNYGGQVTIDELRSEVAKALHFKPPLAHFVLATTAPSDAKIQMEARLLTAQHVSKGLFTVDVFSWEEIQLRLADYPELVHKHFPAFAHRALVGFEKVDSNAEGGEPNPRKFFLGWKATFADLKAEVDVRRTLQVGDEETSYQDFRGRVYDDASTSHLYVLFAEGGSGKTTFLRRLALDLSLDSLSVYRALLGSPLTVSSVIDYAKANSDTPTFLILDDAQAVGKQILNLNDELMLFPNRTVVVAASRRNEWNAGVGPVRESSFHAVHLALLSTTEAKTLIANLERAGALGQLETLSAEGRLDSLMVGARRQLLAGLLEATHGAGFREIVKNEYDSISHEGAKFVYAFCCLMQQMGVFLPLPVARAVALNADQLTFEREILAQLELVVQIETSVLGDILLPRHWNIANELLAQLCPTRERQFDLALRSLQRLNGVSHMAKALQSVASMIGERMLVRQIIQTEEEAYALGEALLAAGTKDFHIGQGARDALRTQRISYSQRGIGMDSTLYAYPSQKQFLVVARIFRQWINDAEASRVISEGLLINNEWHLLTLALAHMKFDSGDIVAAELLVRRVDAGRSRKSTSARLSIPFAMAIMKLRSQDNPQLALRYLRLAYATCRRGMSDPEGYFLAQARLLLMLKRPLDAIRALERGRTFVVEPRRIVMGIEQEYASLLATHDVARFYRTAESRFSQPGGGPWFYWRLFGNLAVTKRDGDGVRMVMERHPNPPFLITDLSEDALRRDDAEGVRFLRVQFAARVSAESKLLYRVFAPAVRARNAVEFRAVLELVDDAVATVRALIVHYGEEGDMAALEFVNGIEAVLSAAVDKPSLT